MKRSLIVLVCLCLLGSVSAYGQFPVIDSLRALEQDTTVNKMHLYNQIANEWSRIADQLEDYTYYTYAIFYETQSYLSGNDHHDEAISLWNLAYYYYLFRYYNRAAAYMDWAKYLYGNLPNKDQTTYAEISDFAARCDSTADKYYTRIYDHDKIRNEDEPTSLDSSLYYTDMLFFCAHAVHALNNDTDAINYLNIIYINRQYLADSIVTQACHELAYYHNRLKHYPEALSYAEQYLQRVPERNDENEDDFDQVIKIVYDVWQNGYARIDTLPASLQSRLHNHHANSLIAQADDDDMDPKLQKQLSDQALEYALAHHAAECKWCGNYLLDQADDLLRKPDYAKAEALLRKAEPVFTDAHADPFNAATLLSNLMLAQYHLGMYDEAWRTEQKLRRVGRHQVTLRRFDSVLVYRQPRVTIVMENSTADNMNLENTQLLMINSTVDTLTAVNTQYSEEGNAFEQLDARVQVGDLTIDRLHGQTTARLNSLYVSDLLDLIQKQRESGMHEDAEQLAYHALQVVEHIPNVNQSQKALAHYHLAELCMYKGAWQEATEHINEADAYYQHTNELEMRALLKVLYSEYYRHFDNPMDAFRQADDAMGLLNQLNLEQTDPDNTCRIVFNFIESLFGVQMYSQGVEMLVLLQDYVRSHQGEDHPNMAKIWLLNLAFANLVEEEDRGMASYFRARRIMAKNEKTLLGTRQLARMFGKDFIHMNELGAKMALTFHKDSLAQATSNEALQYAVKIYGELHPYVLPPILLLAEANLRLGGSAVANAWRNITYANTLAQQIYSTTHRIVGEMQWMMAELALAQKNIPVFEQHVDTTLQIFSHNIRHEFTFLTSSQRAQYWLRQSRILDDICAYALRLQTPAISQSAYDAALITKGMLLKTDIEIANIVAQSQDSALHNQYMRLLELNDQQRLALEHNTAFTAEQEKEKEYLEQHIQQRVLEYGDFTKALSIRWSDVRQHLQNSDVAVEFLSVPLDDATVYCALLLRHNSKHPELIPLFREQDAKALIGRNVGTTYSYDANGKDLSNLVWQNLLPKLKQGETVYFAPVGLLHQLAIEALPYDEEQMMADKFNLVRLSSTREIALPKDAARHATATLYGGIKYDVASEELQQESEKYADRLTGMRSVEVDAVYRRGVGYLPGTKTEVETISSMLADEQIHVQSYFATQANEESFKVLSGTHQNILHIATHGFYWSDSTAQNTDYFSQRMLSTDEELSAPLPIDPLNRCGLLFAGANTALMGYSADLPEGVQDGILTAKEISLLDLRDADLVVLSACETGKGEVTGEGVFGLQRAFKMAGAQTIVMSLWPVNDAATRLLMTEFYRNWITLKQPKRTAFRNAQNTVRTQYEEPVYWAGFVMLD